jgi:hypothetical protein
LLTILLASLTTIRSARSVVVQDWQDFRVAGIVNWHLSEAGDTYRWVAARNGSTFYGDFKYELLGVQGILGRANARDTVGVQLLDKDSDRCSITRVEIELVQTGQVCNYTSSCQTIGSNRAVRSKTWDTCPISNYLVSSWFGLTSGRNPMYVSHGDLPTAPSLGVNCFTNIIRLVDSWTTYADMGCYKTDYPFN